MKVGLSISFCVRDIARGEVSIDEVKFISAGTRAKDRDDWEFIISGYRHHYWYEQPDECERILRHFLEQGLVIQPRLEGRQPVRYPEGRYWIEEEEYNTLAAEGPHDQYLSREEMKRRYMERHKLN